MNANKKNIVLCGFMATGKSTVGKRLASALGYDFLDMDAMITAEAGMPIPQIFATQGEAAFRAMETGMVRRVASRTGCVVATGGGTIVNPHNLEILKQCGVVITLSADPQTILSRVGSAEDRPMLWGGDKLERIATLLAQRDEAYSKADLIVDAAQPVDQVVKNILDSLGLHPLSPETPATGQDQDR
jgi:shikimate kinase